MLLFPAALTVSIPTYFATNMLLYAYAVPVTSKTNGHYGLIVTEILSDNLNMYDIDEHSKWTTGHIYF